MKEIQQENTWKMFGIRQKHFLYRPGTTTCQQWMKWQGHCKKKHHRVDAKYTLNMNGNWTIKSHMSSVHFGN